jgi:poly(3-hydroxybutyrate) depolymerase
MQYFYAICMFFSLLLSGCGGQTAPEASVNQANSNSTKLGKRTFITALPSSYQPQRSYKLLLVFHGSGGTAAGMQQLSAFERYSEDYIVAYLQSEQVEWNEGCDCNIAHRLAADDLGFVQQVIAHLSKQYLIASGEVYAAGFSQGGLFAQNVACNLSQQVKAVAVVAAPMSVQLADKCQPVDPVSIMMVMAKDDATLPYQGQSHPNFGLLSAPAAIQLFAQLNRSLPVPIRKTLHNGLVELEAYSNGEQKAELYSIQQGSHQWQFAASGGSFHSSKEIIRFFHELAQPTLPQYSKLVAVNGFNYHVRLLGAENTGPAVVLLAGPNQNYHSDSAWFSLVQPLLAKHYRVYSIDRLGNAWSDVDHELSYQRFAKDLGVLLTRLQEKEVSLVAFASGSIAARLFYQYHHQQIAIRSMLLIDPDVPMPQSLALYQAYPVDWYQAQLPTLLPHLATGAWNARTSDKLRIERQTIADFLPRKYQALMDWQYFDLVSQQRLLVTHQQSRAREIASYATDLEVYQALAPLSGLPVSVIDSDFENVEQQDNAEHALSIQRWQQESNAWNQTQAAISGGDYLPVASSNHLLMLQHPELVLQAMQALMNRGE